MPRWWQGLIGPRVKSRPHPPPPTVPPFQYGGISQVTWFQLKGSICIRGEHLLSSALWYYRRETASGVLVSMCGAPIQLSSVSTPPLPSLSFLSLHSLINVLCALWRCIIHQPKWPGSAPRQPATKVTLSCAHAFEQADRETKKNISLLLSAGNILWQSNNLFHISFECLTMCLLKGATKMLEPQGFLCGYFDPAGRHWRAHFNGSGGVVPPTAAALCRVTRPLFRCPHQTSNTVISQCCGSWKCVSCVRVGKNVSTTSLMQRKGRVWRNFLPESSRNVFRFCQSWQE